METKPSITEIAIKAGLQPVPFVGGVMAEFISGIQDRRRHAAESALGAMSKHVGWDAFLSIVERDPEIEAILWMALQAIMNTGMKSKRQVLQQVVANALDSDEPIDMDHVKVTALSELDQPHIRALVRLIEAERIDAETPTELPNNLLEATAREPVPIVSALARTGAVFPISTVAEPVKRLVTPGVTDFGRDLVADLRDNGLLDSPNA